MAIRLLNSASMTNFGQISKEIIDQSNESIIRNYLVSWQEIAKFSGIFDQETF